VHARSDLPGGAIRKVLDGSFMHRTHMMNLACASPCAAAALRAAQC